MQGRELSQFVTDFTWYLRNLMLIKSSDLVEDVIDVSSDNLVRLKEEAQLADMDTIMRYIRIFSELSGQLRYASQKRILIEIALIKLCKPAMETTQDAILDRIREVEDKLEKGVMTVPANSPPQPEGSAAASQKPRPPIPKAVPDDIRQIVAKWPSIAGNADNPMKMYLKSARLSLGGENRLLMVVEDGIASDYFLKHPENTEQLERLLADFAGKEVSVTVQPVRNEREFEQNYVDLSQIIHMEIEEE